MTEKRLFKGTFAAVLRIFISFALGALAAYCKVLGRGAVYLPAVVSVLSPAAGCACLAGALPFLLFGVGAYRVSAYAAAVCVLLVRLLFDGIEKRRYPLAAFLISSFVLLSSGLLACAVSGTGLREYLLTAVSAAVGGTMVYTFSSVFTTPSLSDMKKAENSQMIVLIIAVISAACSAGTEYINLGRIICLLISAVFIYRLDRSEAATASLLASAGTVIYFMTLDQTVLGAPLAAAVCPERIKKSRTSLALYFFAFVVLVSSVQKGCNISETLISCAAASAAFLLMPKSFLEKPIKEKPSAHYKNTKNAQLSFLTERLSSVFGSVKEGCAEKEVKISDFVYAGVCMDCDEYARCFGETYQNAQEALFGLDCEKHRDSLEFCVRSSDVKNCVKEAVKKQKYLLQLKKDSENRSVCFESVMSAVIKSMSKLALPGGSAVMYNEEISERIKNGIERDGIFPLECYADLSGCAELYFKGGTRINEKRLVKTVGGITGLNISETFLSETENCIRLILTPEPEYYFEAGVCQLAKNIGDCPGDYALLWNEGRYSYVVVSDGMGTGKSARYASEKLANLIKELSESGMPMDAALTLAFEYAKSCFREEDFATLDILRCDVFSGETDFYKCGAGRSFVISDGKVLVIPAGGFPVGIIDSLCFSHQKLASSDEAVFIMMTDGADFSDGEAALKILEKRKNYGCEELAAAVTQSAFAMQNDETKDDITAAVIRMSKKR